MLKRAVVETGVDRVMNRPWLNRMLLRTLAGEARYLSRPHRRLPFGHPIVRAALKPR